MSADPKAIVSKCSRFVYLMQIGPNEHPQIVMRKLAKENSFRILSSVSQSVADQWWFWIEWDGEKPAFPPYIVEAG